MQVRSLVSSRLRLIDFLFQKIPKEACFKRYILSDRLRATFGQPVRCDSSLIAVALGGVEPSNDMLTSICITDCLSSLVSLQNDQTAACRDESVVDGGNRYPATYTLDQLLFTHRYICRKDSSNQFCAPQVAEWASQESPAPDAACKDCILGAFQAKLNSPFGYGKDLGGYYSSLTSS